MIPYFELEKELPDELISIKIEEAVAILRSLDTEIDGLLADFSEREKSILPGSWKRTLCLICRWRSLLISPGEASRHSTGISERLLA